MLIIDAYALEVYLGIPDDYQYIPAGMSTGAPSPFIHHVLLPAASQVF